MRRAFACLITAMLASACATPGYVPAVTDKGDYDPQSINTVAASQPTVSVAYGKDSPAQVGELRLPKGKGPFPVAMVVHGGCWLKGMGSIRNTAALSTWLAERGVATWNVDYRELGSGGGWTATFDDWAQALAHLKTLAKTHPLDLDRVSVLGHSAGGTAAVWLASGDKGDFALARDLPKVRAAVLLDAPVRLVDLVGMDRAICGRPVVEPLMGGKPGEVPARYAMVDPLQNNPQSHSFIVVQGQLPVADDIVPALKGRGIDARQVRLSGRSHFNLIAPGTADFVTMAPTLLEVTGGK